MTSGVDRRKDQVFPFSLPAGISFSSKCFHIHLYPLLPLRGQNNAIKHKEDFFFLSAGMLHELASEDQLFLFLEP